MGRFVSVKLLLYDSEDSEDSDESDDKKKRSSESSDSSVSSDSFLSPVPRNRQHKADDVKEQVEDIQIQAQCELERICTCTTKMLDALQIESKEQSEQDHTAA